MKQVKPSDGERRAASGYGGQYRVAALLIYRGLRTDELIWVGVANPEAGRVDDLLLGEDGRVDAFQVKWSQFAGSFSFNDLITPTAKARSNEDTAKPCLIAQLADGWHRLRLRYPGQRVVVHLVTNDFPSKHDSPPATSPGPTPKHFASFLAQAWQPARMATGDASASVLPQWKLAWESLKEASGLSSEDFDLFAKDLELDFGFAVAKSESDSRVDTSNLEVDRAAIERFLFEVAGNPERVSILKRGELITRLGWGDRYRSRSRHEFPTPVFAYEPIRPTKEELETKLSSTRGGYLAVLGAPGSGKSTLLTECLRSRTERKIRYYAYVPDSIDPGRGEARNFLHDVVIAIERAGFRAGESIPGVDRTNLSRRLHMQLEKLHDDFVQNGRRTIILIDGLDHIDREQHPERSLLRDLPPPETLREGVLILLGSQTIQLPELSPAIEFQLRDASRCIEMQSLSRDATLRLLDGSGLSYTLDSGLREQFVELTEGHPLSIDYLLNRLRQTSDKAVAADILHEAVGHGSDVRIQYHAFWQRHVKATPGLRQLLGLLACHRGAIDLDWFEETDDAESVRLLRERASHYFRVEGSRWNFYHNSFRQFILERIAEVSPGVRQEARVRQLHAELALRSSKSDNIGRRWEELHHLMMAGENQRALQQATQVFFRQQFLAFRPPALIRADIEQALRIATQQQDLVALARLLLAFVECGDRESNLEDTSVPTILLDIGQVDRSLILARAGHRLLVGGKEGLRLARKLAMKGQFEAARQLFSLAEPLDQLFSKDEVEVEQTRGERNIFSEWARIATIFRPTKEVLETISSLRLRPRFERDSDVEEFTRSQCVWLVFHAGMGLIRQNRWQDVSQCLHTLDGMTEDALQAKHWLQLRLAESLDAAGEGGRAAEVLEELCSGIDPSGTEVSVTLKLSIAETALSLIENSEWVREVARNLDVPAVTRPSIHADTAWQEFSDVFRIAYLRFYFGEQRTIEQIVPTPAESDLKPTAVVLRDVIRIARISARARRGQEFATLELEAEIRAILRRFSFNKNRTRERHDWYPLFSMRSDIYSLLVRVVRQIDLPSFDRLKRMFEEEWSSPSAAAHWHPELKRSVVLALWRAGASTEWSISELDNIETVMLDGEDLSGRIKACNDQIKSYIQVGAIDRSERLLSQLISIAIGVGYRKDYQLDIWLEWLDLGLDLNPAAREDRIRWYAKAAVSLRDTSERGHASASLKLVEIVAKRDPAAALRLMLWFQDQGVISHEDALATILREALRLDPSKADLVLSLTATVVVAYSMSADRQLVLDIVESLRPKGRTSVIAAARLLVTNVERFAAQSARPGWFDALRSALDSAGIENWIVAIPSTEIVSDRNSSSDDTLQRKDGTKFSAEEVLARISTADDLLNLLSEQVINEDGSTLTSMFDWRKPLLKILPNLDRRKTRQLADALVGRWRDSFCTGMLARHARTIGEAELARELSERSVRQSNHSGWDRYYDGGSRLDALECMVEIDPVRGREEAWRHFREDFHEENFSRVRFAFNLVRICELLSERPPLARLQDEVDVHVHSLFEGVTFVDSDPDLRLREVGTNVDVEEALAGLIEFHLLHPAPWMMEATWRCLGHLFLSRHPSSAKLIERLLSASDEVQERLIPVLESIALEDPPFVESHRERILKLADSPHGGIRCVVRRLAARLRWPRAVRSLPLVSSPPSIYRLALPPASRESIEKIAAQLESPDTCFSDSALSMLLAHGPEIELIARITGIPASNLFARASQIMAEIDPDRRWTEEAENRLRFRLEEMGPKFTYRRPRYLAGRRAVHHLLAELEDHRLATGSEIPRLCAFLGWFDPALVLRMPSVRPREVVGLEVERISYSDRWLTAIDEAFPRLKVHTENATIILAEETVITRPTWEKHREKRLSQFVTSDEIVNEDDDSFFSQITSGVVENYQSYGREDFDPPLVLKNVAYHLEGAGGDWIALNPWVGGDLGWTLTSGGLFRWLNSNAQIMAETVYWVDGPNDLSPYRDDEVGEGCMVLLYPDGARELVERFGPLSRVMRVTRSYLEHGATEEEFSDKIQTWEEAMSEPN